MNIRHSEEEHFSSRPKWIFLKNECIFPLCHDVTTLNTYMEKVLLKTCKKASAVSLTDIGGILVLLLFTGVMG